MRLYHIITLFVELELTGGFVRLFSTHDPNTSNNSNLYKQTPHLQDDIQEILYYLLYLIF